MSFVKFLRTPFFITPMVAASVWLQKGSNNAGKKRFKININPFIANVTFLYPLKTSKSFEDDLFIRTLF